MKKIICLLTLLQIIVACSTNHPPKNETLDYYGSITLVLEETQDDFEKNILDIAHKIMHIEHNSYINSEDSLTIINNYISFNNHIKKSIAKVESTVAIEKKGYFKKASLNSLIGFQTFVIKKFKPFLDIAFIKDKTDVKLPNIDMGLELKKILELDEVQDKARIKFALDYDLGYDEDNEYLEKHFGLK